MPAIFLTANPRIWTIRHAGYQRASGDFGRRSMVSAPGRDSEVSEWIRPDRVPVFSSQAEAGEQPHELRWTSLVSSVTC